MHRLKVALPTIAGVLLFALPGMASAATTIGQTVFAAESCSGPATLLQEAAGASPTYSVPPGGGVITSWTHLESGSGGNIKLAVFRHAGGAPTQYTTVGASDAVTLAAGPNSFLTRVPVREGDTIGMLVISGGVGCTFMTSNAGDVANRDSAAVHDVGSTHTYTEQSPTPRRINVQADVEPDCDGDGLGDETQDTDLLSCDADPPETTITKDAPKKTSKSKVKFKFVSDEPGSTFECKVDKKPFKACSSPRKVKRLVDGKHKFKVRAIDAAGNVDPTPDKDKFTVVD